MCRNCNENELDKDKIKGKIVICDSDDHHRPYEKIDTVKSLGGIGSIIIEYVPNAVAENYEAFPATVISSKDSKDILSYVNSTRYHIIYQKKKKNSYHIHYSVAIN